jgi:AraC-like DNA-binding protein
MNRSIFITTLNPIAGWPMLDRVAYEDASAPAYDALLGRQGRSTATIQITISGQGMADGILAPPGTAVVMDAKSHPRLRYRAIGHWTFLYINLHEATTQIAALVAARGHVVPFPQRHPLIRRWIDRLPEQGDDHLSLAFAESHRLAAEFLGVLAQAPTADGGLAQRALTILADGWDRNLGLAEVARQLGVSSEHLSRTFHRSIGETPAAWYRRHRLERACDLLRTSEQTIQVIAIRCGYPSPAYFIASFRTAMGTTPARWRVNARQIQGGSTRRA